MKGIAVIIVVIYACSTHGFLFPKAKTVDTLDVSKYMGRFYEMYSSVIQRLTFQRNAVCTSAIYTLLPDGTVHVYNSNRYKTPAGELRDINGTAVPTSDPGSFIVNFPSAPKATSPNYLVVKLGPPTYGSDGLYEYSVVTTSRKLLVWILARDPETFAAKYEKEVFDFLTEQGYDKFWNKPRKTYQGKDCIYPPM